MKTGITEKKNTGSDSLKKMSCKPLSTIFKCVITYNSFTNEQKHRLKDCNTLMSKPTCISQSSSCLAIDSQPKQLPLPTWALLALLWTLLPSGVAGGGSGWEIYLFKLVYGLKFLKVTSHEVQVQIWNPSRNLQI